MVTDMCLSGGIQGKKKQTIVCVLLAHVLMHLRQQTIVPKKVIQERSVSLTALTEYERANS